MKWMPTFPGVLVFFNMIPSSLKPYRSCCANKYCLPTGLLFYQAWKQCMGSANRTHAVPTKITPAQYFSSTTQETGHISIPQPSVMQSSYSSLLPLRTGSNLHWHSTEPIGLILCQQRLLPHSTSLPPARRLAISTFRSLCDAILLFLSPPS